MLIELKCSNCKNKLMMAEQEYLTPEQDSHILYCHHCWNLLRCEKDSLNKCINLAISQSKKNSIKVIDTIQGILRGYYDSDGDDGDDE